MVEFVNCVRCVQTEVPVPRKFDCVSNEARCAVLACRARSPLPVNRTFCQAFKEYKFSNIPHDSGKFYFFLCELGSFSM